MQMPWISLRAIACRVMLCFLFIPTISYANFEAGVAWLKAQQQADGSFTSPGTSGTRFQASAEALHILAVANAINDADKNRAFQFLQSDPEQNTEYLARRIVGGANIGANIAPHSEQLLLLANQNGGFGPANGYASTILDTALALNAAHHAKVPVSQKIAAAVSYLVNSQRSTGAWSIAPQSSGTWATGANIPSPYVTALSSIALQRYRFHYSLNNHIAAATEFLLQNQHPAGGWGSATHTAMALISIIPSSTDVTRYSAALQHLLASQQADGSWNNDVLATALALSALHLTTIISGPSDPTNGALTGLIVDDASGMVLHNASVLLQGTSSITVNTAQDGRFVANNLVPENYVVTYSLPGYQAVKQSAAISASQRSDVGTIRLKPALETGIVAGVVTRGDNGQPIANASVAVASNGATVSVVTASDGSYLVAVAPGTATITVSAQGFAAISASASLSGGARLAFSPALALPGSEPPAGTATLRGTVLDAQTGAPLQNALVTVTNATSTATSDATGKFSLAGVPAGEAVLQVSRNGYETLGIKVLTASGMIADLGTFRLQEKNVQTTTIAGKVFASGSSTPIAGATVKAAGFTATSGNDGTYLIEGVPASTLQFLMSASATGYLSASTQVNLQTAGKITIDIPLQAAGAGGMRILSVSKDQASYAAFSEVALTATLANNSDRPRVVRLYINVFDQSGALVGEQPGIVTDGDPAPTFVTIAPGAQQSAPARWFTGSNKPGIYRIVLQALDAHDGTLLSEFESTLQINETRIMDALIVLPEPNYLVQGQTAEVSFSAKVVHRSNMPFTATLNFSFMAPNGQVLHAVSRDIAINPAVAQMDVPLGQFTATFDLPGEYSVKLDSFNGPEPSIKQGRPLYVAADTRIEIEQEILPKTVVPGQDKQINLQIRLKGVTK